MAKTRRDIERPGYKKRTDYCGYRRRIGIPYGKIVRTRGRNGNYLCRRHPAGDARLHKQAIGGERN